MLLSHTEIRAVEPEPMAPQPLPGSLRETRQDPALGGGAPARGNGADEAPMPPPKPMPVVRRAAAQIDPSDAATWGKVPRNAPCPCGSGRKYKHCHGKVA
jgi:preprotein translocase subunit SecA